MAGSDYIHGIYRNVEFTYSDLELKLESQDYTANDNNMKTTITEFSGQFITVSLSKIVNGSVQIIGKMVTENLIEIKSLYLDMKITMN